MSEITYKGMTAAQYRAAAKRSRERVSESRARSDTDGFMSQWAGDITAQMYELQAEILEAGGVDEFPALFDLHGNLIAAKLVSTYNKYSHTHESKWAILASDDPHSKILEYVKLSDAQDDERRIKNNAKKGYYEGVVIAPAAADTFGASKTSVSVTVVRTDDGFSRDVQIVDSGKLPEVRKLRRQTGADVAKWKEHDVSDDVFDIEDPEDVRELALARAEKPAKTSKRAPRTKTAKSAKGSSEKRTRAASTSHADCAHESTKAARAKCRRERAAQR